MKQFRRAVFPFSVIVGLAFSTQATQTPVAANATTPTSLTPAQWKVVEGCYQSASNKSLYIQAIAHDSVLPVKIMWMKSVDTHIPMTPVPMCPRRK